MAKSGKIPKRKLWAHRYGVYRREYGRLKAFWRAIVLSELYVLTGGRLGRGIIPDEIAFLQDMVTVEVTKIEFHL